MNCLTHRPTFCYYFMSDILKVIDVKAVLEGNLEAISDFFCGSGHVIHKHGEMGVSMTLHDHHGPWNESR